MPYLITSIFVIVITLMLNSERISRFFQRRQEKQEIEFKKNTGLDLWKLTKISPGITWVGGQIRVSNPEYYFDNQFLYVIRSTYVRKHSIANIIEVKRTAYSQNDRRVWKIVIKESGDIITYEIVTNQSLASCNFSNFLDRVNENADSVVDSEWLL